MTLMAACEETFSFGMMKANGRGNISLKSVEVTGDITGLLFSSSIRQTYRNETSRNLEIVYTFPVAWHTALLGLSARIGDKSLVGIVVEKKEAERTYEKAISDGDSAIMVQKSSMGLYTANLGNIKSGETVDITIHCSRLLNIVDGKIRISIPTVISERYGNSHGFAGLAAHESARVDSSARYPFNLEINLWGDVARSKVYSPSHSLMETVLENGLNLRLHGGAVLDRDFVLVLDGVNTESQALVMPDNENWMVAASFLPNIAKCEQSNISLKILVDCSGSMHGDRINKAKQGLHKIVQFLSSDDQISFTRFGSNYRHMTHTMLPCRPDVIARLVATINNSAANMGGTEMNMALQSVFYDIKSTLNEETPVNVLLITDGDVWDIQNIIDSARTSGHRIFTIGVGNAPAEPLLRSLVEKTGGACEFVTQNESITDAIIRMFHRMRGDIAKNVSIDWKADTLWHSQYPKFIYDGETVHAFAVLKSKPEIYPELCWQSGDETICLQCEYAEEVNNQDFVRMGRMTQINEISAKQEKLDLALKYQLVCDLTSLILVYEREENDKLYDLPRLQKVPQMSTAKSTRGNGCQNSWSSPLYFSQQGSVCSFRQPGEINFNPDIDDLEFPMFLRCTNDGPRGGSVMCSSFPNNDIDHTRRRRNTELKNLAVQWNNEIYTLSSVSELINLVLVGHNFKFIREMLASIEKTTSLDKVKIFAILMLMILEHENNVSRHSLRVINKEIGNLDEDILDEIKNRLKACIDSF